MQTDPMFLWLTVFVATIVEMVEALTILLALGVVRGWRSVLLGAASALVVLAVVVFVFNQIYMEVDDEKFIPIKPLWSVVGTLLLIFGLQWMKKAVLRISGVLKSRDEKKRYETVSKDASRIKRTFTGIDWYSFVMSFKGMLLEGFEVVFIVIIFGSVRGDISIGVSAAVSALIFVAILGAVIHKPLTKVPDNIMKLSVGVILVTFGTYFAAEGANILWPLGEWAMLYLLVFYILMTLFVISMLKGRAQVGVCK